MVERNFPPGVRFPLHLHTVIAIDTSPRMTKTETINGLDCVFATYIRP